MRKPLLLLKEENAFDATEEHSGHQYGVLRADLNDNIKKKIISVVDFQDFGFLKLMQDATLATMGIGMVYEDTEEAR